ncbi:lasso peptide biosynthesis PqqD family chaperone [Amycolatopsis mediterranei]|uniref:lasso peptide biosynthesis PqqD family chaperone n=1 Tax=Amycolatopsis mediterranei TaxID=33910 RepID=UPI00342603A3
MIALPDNVSFTSTEYGGVLLDEKTAQYWQLNGAGAVALRTMIDGGDAAAAAAAVCELYDTTSEIATTDINQVLTELRTAGLIRVTRESENE